MSLRLQAVDLLYSAGLEHISDAEALVPSTTTASWPSAPFGEGLESYLDFLRLERIRCLRHPRGAYLVDDDEPTDDRDVGRVRLARVLKSLARLEAEHVRIERGENEFPLDSVGIDRVVRLLEVPHERTRDWSGWYSTAEAVADIYHRMFQALSARRSSADVDITLDRFRTAWSDDGRAHYWPLRRRVEVLAAAGRFGADRERLDRQLHQIAEELRASTEDPHVRLETWLSLARAWADIDDVDLAVVAVSGAVRTAFGPGVHHDDMTLSEWSEWLALAADSSALAGHQRNESIVRFATRIAVAATEAPHDAAKAAHRLVGVAWAGGSTALATRIAQDLCDQSVLTEPQAIEAVLAAAALDAEVPTDLLQQVACHLLMPVLKHPPSELIDALRNSSDADALGKLQHCESVWLPADGHRSEVTSADPAPEESSDDDARPPIETAHQLLASMRREPDADDFGCASWIDSVVDVVLENPGPDLARALLAEARRLRLDGRSMGLFAAAAARSGAVEQASDAIKDVLAHQSIRGWQYHYDRGKRTQLFDGALVDRNPVLVALATADLVNALQANVFHRLRPEDLLEIVRVVYGIDVAEAAWPDVEALLDQYVPLDQGGLSPQIEKDPASSLEALLGWLTTFLGHPIRPLDFGARHALCDAAKLAPRATGDALATALSKGGWTAEATLHALNAPRYPEDLLTPALAQAVQDATGSGDSICRDLARQVAKRFEIVEARPPHRPLDATYGLVLPDLPHRAPPTLDKRGVPHIDYSNATQVVAPYDEPIALLAEFAHLDPSAMTYRAAAIAQRLDEPWLAGGHRAFADRLHRRGLPLAYRPWAYMAGRRALGQILAELADSGDFDDMPEYPAYALGLIDSTLALVETHALDASTPIPWRPQAAGDYDLSGWCRETDDAATRYAADISGLSAYVLAERSEWRGLDWAQPEEYRHLRTFHSLHERPPNLAVPVHDPWELTSAGADNYPEIPGLSWSGGQLVLRGQELFSDAPWVENWLAFHPTAGLTLGWLPGRQEPLEWIGDDGQPRARTVRRAAGQLSHSPPETMYCAEVWQVVLSPAGLAEIEKRFGRLERRLTVERVLPARERSGRDAPERRAARVRLT